MMRVQMMIENVECPSMVLGKRDDIVPQLGRYCDLRRYKEMSCGSVVRQAPTIQQSGRKSSMTLGTMHGKYPTSARSIMKDVGAVRIFDWSLARAEVYGFLNL